MPAVPVALAEIQDRLEEIRYRLNRRTLVAVLSPAVAILMILAALVTWSAARGTAESFVVAWWAAVTAAIVVLVWAAIAMYQRWLDLGDAARLADARAGMHERLTTVLWLNRSGAQTPLTPVVVADAYDFRSAWQASTIIQKRFPWELGFPVGAMLALGAAVFLDDPLMPSLEELLAKQPSAEKQMEMVVPIPPPPPTPADAEDGQPGPSGAALLEVAGEGGGESGELGTELGEPGDRATTSAALTAQVRDAIRKALQNFEQTDRPRDLAKGGGAGGDDDKAETDLPPQPGLFDVAHSTQAGAQSAKSKAESGDAVEGADGKKAGASPEAKKRGRDASESVDLETKLPSGKNDNPKSDQRAVEADPYQQRKEDADVASMPGTGEAPETEDGVGSGGREHDRPADEARTDGKPDPRAKPKPGDASVAGNLQGKGNQKGGGQASRASGGSGDLYGVPGTGSAKGDQLPGKPQGTFKLTLGSFLTGGPGVADKNNKRERVTAINPRAAVAEPPALNPNQTADDALRRADIPPEYEEVVRRIYSARPAR